MSQSEIPRGVRKQGDRYWIPRPDALIERWLNRHFLQLPNSLQWVERYNEDHSYLGLIPGLKGKSVLLAGRGESVHLPDGYEGAVVAINSAANFFIDKGHVNTYFFSNDKTIIDYPLTMIITSKNEPVPERTCYLFNPVEFGCYYNTASAIVAINMLLQIGVSEIMMTGFDILDGNAGYYDTVNTSTAQRLSRQVAPLNVLLQDPRVRILRKSLASTDTRKEDHTPVEVVPDTSRSSSSTVSDSSKKRSKRYPRPAS